MVKLLLYNAVVWCLAYSSQLPLLSVRHRPSHQQLDGRRLPVKLLSKEVPCLVLYAYEQGFWSWLYYLILSACVLCLNKLTLKVHLLSLQPASITSSGAFNLSVMTCHTLERAQADPLCLSKNLIYSMPASPVELKYFLPDL